MGMQSYFFTLWVSRTLTDKGIKEFFQQNYKVSPYLWRSEKLLKRYNIDAKRFVIDKKAVVKINTLRNETSITFELCFCNYNENVEYMYNVLKKLNIFLGKGTQLILINIKYDFNLLDLEKFRKILKESHKDKLNIFQNKYGNIKEDILPQNFYSQLNKLMRKINKCN